MVQGCQTVRTGDGDTLEVIKELGDLSEIAAALLDIAIIKMQRKLFQEAFEHLSESYVILKKIRRLDGNYVVGLDLGKLLCQEGQKEKGMEILKSLERRVYQAGKGGDGQSGGRDDAEVETKGKNNLDTDMRREIRLEEGPKCGALHHYAPRFYAKAICRFAHSLRCGDGKDG